MGAGSSIRVHAEAAFNAADTDKDGKLTLQELGAVLQAKGFAWSPKRIEGFLCALDENGDGITAHLKGLEQLTAATGGLREMQQSSKPAIAAGVGAEPQRTNSDAAVTGCAPSRVATDDGPALGLQAKADPRWDVEGFNRCADACQCAWVRVGYLRELKELGTPIPYQQLAPDGALCFGAPPPDVQLYAMSPYTWLGEKASPEHWRRQPTQDERAHSDPNGFLLHRLVDYLNQDGAFDDDLVVFLHISARCFAPTPSDQVLWQNYMNYFSIYISTYYRLKCVPVLEVPEAFDGEPVIQRLWGIHEFFLAAYCQRIVNSWSPLVKPNLTPEKLRSAHALLHNAPGQEKDRELILGLRREYFGRMLPARDDAVGFQTVCEQSGLRWVRVWFIHELVSRGGPAPRCQDLPYGAYAEGRVPEGSRHFVVSHGWAAHLHFDPSGGKLRDLAAVLIQLGAARDDVVFLDFMSLTQAGGWVPKAYLKFNRAARRHALEENEKGDMVLLSGRTEVQERRFRFALFETTRLYAFHPPTGPSVIILPQIEPPESFPEPGAISWEENTFCQPPRREQKSAWGFSKSIAYENAGWPCAEYAVARMNGTIANSDDPAVKRVENARNPWPEDVDAYAALMDEEAAEPVAFTKKGDREAVRFNFYKYSYSVTE